MVLLDGLLGVLIGILTVLLVLYRPRGKSKFNRHNLITFEVAPENIDSVLFNELWQLRKAYWPTDTPKGYRKMIREMKNSTFVLFRDAVEGSLRGCYCKTFMEGKINGKPYKALYLGNLFFYTYYRGSFKLGTNMLQAFFKHWWNTPRGVKCYIVFSAISYKSYVAAAHTYPNLYPTYKNNYNPEAKEIGSQVMGALYPEEWNAEEWKLHLKDTEFDAAIIRPEMIQQDKHIEFFAKTNPDYQKGVTFPGVIHVTFYGLLKTLISVSSRKTTVRAHRAKPIKERDLARTMQDQQRAEAAAEKKKKARKTVSKLRMSGKTDPSLSNSHGSLNSSPIDDQLSKEESKESLERLAEKEHKRRVHKQEKLLRVRAQTVSVFGHVPHAESENPYYSGQFPLPY